MEAKGKGRVVIEAVVTRANGAVENLGVIAEQDNIENTENVENLEEVDNNG